MQMPWKHLPEEKKNWIKSLVHRRQNESKKRKLNQISVVWNEETKEGNGKKKAEWKNKENRINAEKH